MGTPCPRKLQRKGGYWRYRSAQSEERDALVECYRCPLSGRCFSVIPEDMMPYRPLSAEEVGAYADQQGQCGYGAEQMIIATSGRQRRGWQGFWSAFSAHALLLAGILGVDLASGPAEVWQALRGQGEQRRRVGAILIGLHAHQTSLTGSYWSLKPWWAGGLARGP